jgi:LPXTG-motif cell wall-anchored protein
MPEDGLTVHKENGDDFGDTAHDGDELWLKASEDGTLKLDATATGVKAGVRFFTNEQFQDFGLAVVSPQSVDASVSVTFTTPPVTTAPPTTAPEATTVPITPETTVITPQTTVVNGSTTTVPVTPSGGLPVTGAQTALLAALAVLLIGIGTAFGIVSRRRRNAET